MVLMNIVPVLLLGVFLWSLNYIVPKPSGIGPNPGGHNPTDSNTPEIVPVLVAAIASLSVFGLHRILHAFIASENRWQRYYTVAEWKAVMEAWCPRELERVNTFWSHLGPGLAYLFGVPAFAFLVGGIYPHLERTMKVERLIIIADLTSLVMGFVGTICLARAVDVPPGSVASFTSPRGTYYFAGVIPRRWWWGVGLIAAAFVLQLLKAILGLIN